MKFLVDADVLSEPTKPVPERRVVEWLIKHESEVVLSVVTLGEIRFGILALPAGRKRSDLLRWFEAGAGVLPALDFDSAVAQVWAELLAKLRRAGTAMPIKDSLVAATAKRHSLTLVTRNTPDFENAGVKLVNPFAQ